MKNKKFLVTLATDQIEALNELAWKFRTSRAGLIRQIIKQCLEKNTQDLDKIANKKNPS